jgi:hypothetical protein
MGAYVVGGDGILVRHPVAATHDLRPLEGNAGTPQPR